MRVNSPPWSLTRGPPDCWQQVGAGGGHHGALQDVGQTGGSSLESSPARHDSLDPLLGSGDGGQADRRDGPGEGEWLTESDDREVMVQADLVILRMSDDLTDLQPELALVGGEAVLPHHQVGRVGAVGGGEDLSGGEERPATVRGEGSAVPEQSHLPRELVQTSSRSFSAYQVIQEF